MNKFHPLKINTRNLTWDNNEPRSLDHDDRFFQSNVIDETSEVFIKANNLLERWAENKKINFKIAELGFGFGLNFLITAKYWYQHNQNSKEWLDYVSIDCFPLNIKDFKKVVANYPELKEFSDEFIEHFPIECNGFTRVEIPKFRIRLTLIINNVEDALVSLIGNKNNKFDAWYLDGFDPNKNLSMWSSKVFESLYLLSNKNATFGTYTAAGFVRRGLEENGFKVSRVKGFANKRHRLQGVYKNGGGNFKSKIVPKKIAIIGSGIAGTCLAYKLASQNISVDLFDKKKDLNLNPWAAMYPKFSLGIDSRSELLIEGYFYSHRFYSKILNSFMNTGITFLDNGSERNSWIDRIIKLDRDDLFTQQSPEDINLQNNINQSFGGLKINLGGCISIDELNKTLVAHKNINLINGKDFLEYEIDNKIKLKFKEGNNYEGYSHLILASGGTLKSVIPKIRLKHGAIAGFRDKKLNDIKYPINNSGYILPKFNNLNWAGSIYSNDEILDADIIDYKKIIHKNNHLLTEDDIKNIKKTWLGVRASLPDYLPVAGAIEQEKVFVLGGLGSRGLSLAPLLAETIMNDICNIPSPISQEVREAISPLRFND
ncbi:MAG: tRNA (5-methylaminomethyl-2-thiouridine)(34)-methyltransferase MnmD [SAR86 cluster bacterium]|uniref:tRNA (5-methylaminomethyl-2-thiouridine)(34)-methyltransferase MnmD n=1 Tax=SAR86 cluster bacterium TaxID=2030880 RepID=A0A937M0F1_9GAMM|nr:tRNA (5-methylaminomethyl-2-thiouridine)(34)-methyltransferase MnmD [SAR86 cluster bacterium]